MMRYDVKHIILDLGVLHGFFVSGIKYLGSLMLAASHFAETARREDSLSWEGNRFNNHIFPAAHI